MPREPIGAHAFSHAVLACALCGAFCACFSRCLRFSASQTRLTAELDINFYDYNDYGNGAWEISDNGKHGVYGLRRFGSGFGYVSGETFDAYSAVHSGVLSWGEDPGSGSRRFACALFERRLRRPSLDASVLCFAGGKGSRRRECAGCAAG